MAADLKGGCACGAVRYSVKAEPKFAFFCQCRDCQHMTGSGHATQFAADANAFDVTGALGVWERTNSAGYTVSKAFCPTCGAPVFGKTSRAPDNVMVLAGSLDDPAVITPDRIFFAEEAQPWDHPTAQGGPA